MRKLIIDNGQWRILRALILALSILNYPLSISFAGTGCTYPSTLDTFTDGTDGAGWQLTLQTENIGSKLLSFNKLQCAAEKIEAELGTLPKGSYATVKARLDDAAYLTATQTLTNKTLTSPVIQGTITPGTGQTWSMTSTQANWTWGTATGTTNLFSLSDGTSNIGTGILLKATTASGSSVKPFQADANGNGVQVTTAGLLQKIGTGGLDAASITGAIPIANGGTGQNNQTAAFNALDPLTTKGDFISHNGTDSVRVAVGANDTMTIADSTQSAGWRWGTVPLHATGPGVEFVSNKLTLLRCAADNKIPKFTLAAGWACGDDNASTGTTLGAWGSRGQRSLNNTTTPNTKFDLIADTVILRNSSKEVAVIHAPSTITNDITASNATDNGRDQSGSFSANSWIHFYWVWDGTTLKSRSSTTAPPTGPALQGGETHWAYAGAVRLNGSSVLLKTRFWGSMAFIDEDQAVQRVLAAGQSTSFTSVDMSTLVPPNASTVMVNLISSVIHNTININLSAVVRTAGTAASNVNSIVAVVVTQVAGNTVSISSFGVVANVGQALEYRLAAVPSGGGGAYLDVLGYAMPNGGV